MKKSILLLSILSIVCFISANAQNPITTLQHNGATQVFYGQGSFVDALTASVNGDTLNLSAGYFAAPASIAKGVNIIGSGYFPDSANVATRTFIMGGFSINAGADSLKLEGLFINGDINYASAISINYVKVIRCLFINAIFNSNSATASKNNCSFEECYIFGLINFSYYGDNLLVKHCIVSTSIVYINGNALIDGNIFLKSDSPYYCSIGTVKSSQINNNIFIGSSNQPLSVCTGNNISNNIFCLNSVNFTYNIYNNNYTGISQASIFVNQTGNTIDYTHNYHLQNPTLYIGTDGTQIGLYGGDGFKEKGAPSNPQITSKNIGTKTDVNGNLQISISAKAQDK